MEVGVERGVAAGVEEFPVPLADAGEARVLVLHFFEALLGAAVGVPALPSALGETAALFGAAAGLWRRLE